MESQSWEGLEGWEPRPPAAISLPWRKRKAVMGLGEIRESFETSIGAAIELDTVDVNAHAAIIAAARAAADALDAGDATASMLGTYLNYCKTLGIVPERTERGEAVVGSGRVAGMRAKSRARLRAV